jgi:foldase protein PrsA
MAFLVSGAWLEQEAAWRGIAVAPAEVQSELAKTREQQFKTNAAWQRFLRGSGQTLAALELRVRLKLLSSRIQQKVTSEASKEPTQQEIKAYYEHQKQQPERRNLLIVLTATEGAARKAKAEIKSGKSFASVAKERSIDPTTKDKGGALPGVKEGEEVKALNEAIFAAKPNVLVGPVQTPFGYYVFEVEKIIASTQQPLTSVESSIKQKIMTQKQQSALGTLATDFKNHMTSLTQCGPGFVVQDCANYVSPTTTPSPQG